MKKIERTDDEAQSLDIVAENIEKLKQLFPQIVEEDTINFEALQQLLGEEVEVKDEYYRFTWPGKHKARQEALKTSTGTLRPAPEESVNWDHTENLYIEGDNLEVLKLLQRSYARKVKMIYIDPPYNTGKDFVYKDNYKDNLKEYNEKFNRLDGAGNLLSSDAQANAEGHARYHSNWLNMMYPRLHLARNLLRDDGVIFISIGPEEVSNLNKLCNEIFGIENFIGNAGRISKKANNQGDFWAPNFDYLLTYAKDIEFTQPFFGGINYDSYKYIEEYGERKGEKYQPIRLYMTSLDPMRGCNNQRYFIECPDGTFVIPPGEVFPEIIEDASFVEPMSRNDKVWRWSYRSYLEKKDQLIIRKVRSSNLVDEFGNPAKWNVYTKTFLNDVIKKSSASPNSFIEEHLNQSSSHELKKLKIPFDFAKPSSLIKFLQNTSNTNFDDIVLDFFSGSSTTAHGVLSLNKEDVLKGKKGKRKFILVQLPEPTEEKSEARSVGYNKISDIGKERIRRVGEKIKKELKEAGNEELIEKLDLGFKVFKLDSSNIHTWSTDPEDLEVNLFQEQVIKDERTVEDVLYEILLKYGFDLTLPIEEATVAGKKVFNVGGAGQLLVCLDDGIDRGTAQALIDYAQEDEIIDTKVVFKDAGFVNDVEKTNVYQLLKSHGIENVKTI